MPLSLKLDERAPKSHEYLRKLMLCSCSSTVSSTWFHINLFCLHSSGEINFGISLVHKSHIKISLTLKLMSSLVVNTSSSYATVSGCAAPLRSFAPNWMNTVCDLCEPKKGLNVDSKNSPSKTRHPPEHFRLIVH